MHWKLKDEESGGGGEAVLKEPITSHYSVETQTTTHGFLMKFKIN